jgi:hypothetical protein
MLLGSIRAEFLSILVGVAFRAAFWAAGKYFRVGLITELIYGELYDENGFIQQKKLLTSTCFP